MASATQCLCCRESPNPSPAPASMKRLGEIQESWGCKICDWGPTLPAFFHADLLPVLNFCSLSASSNQAARLKGSALILSMNIPSGFFISFSSLHTLTVSDSHEQNSFEITPGKKNINKSGVILQAEIYFLKSPPQQMHRCDLKS